MREILGYPYKTLSFNRHTGVNVRTVYALPAGMTIAFRFMKGDMIRRYTLRM